MRSSILVALIGLGSCFLGVCIGRGSRAELRAERDAALAAAARPDGEVRPVCMATIDPDVLRSELARALHANGAPPTAATEPEPTATAAKAPPPPPSPQQEAALEKAQGDVDRTLTRGTLNVAEAEDLRNAIHQVQADAQFELTRRLIVAMNQGQLKIEPHAFPF